MRQMDRRPGQKKKKAPAKPGAYGARINQLFQDAIRDLEALKQQPRPKALQPR